MNQWTSRLARAVYRKGSDNVKELPFALQALLLGIPLFAAALVVSFAFPSFSKEFRDFGRGRPSIPFSFRDWHVVYGDSIHAPLVHADCKTERLCLARPENPILWNSHHRKDDRTRHFRKVNALGHEGTYWIGLRVPGSMVTEAIESGATRIILGYLAGSFEIYLNGKLFRQSHSEPVRRPLILSQLENFQGVLKAGQDLHIAVKMVNGSGAIFPDALAEPMPSGFAKPEEITYFMRSVVFEWQSSSFFLAGTFFSLGFFFFLIAVANRRKIEYCAVSAYALLSGFRQTLQMSLVFSTLGETTTARLLVFLSGLEAAVVILLGLSICRANFRLLFRSTLAMLSLAALPVLLVRDPFELLATGHFLWQGLVLPGSYLLGSVLCYSQWHLIRADRLQERLEEDRLSRLAVFAGIFLAMGLVQLCQRYVWGGGVGLEGGVIYRMASLFFVLTMGGLAVRTYNVQLQLLNKGITSRYHRRKELPEYLEGALLEVDIKGSEAVFRLDHRPGAGAAVMQECLSRLWQTGAALGGEVIRTEGDSLTCFFEGGREAFVQAAEAAVAMRRTLDQFCEEADAASRAAFPGGCLQFRASVLSGRIKPTWQTVDGRSQPGWQEAGETNVFVDSSRLQEIEKEVCGRDTSLVVLHAEEAELVEGALAAKGIAFSVKDQVFLGKHSRPYRISGFEPRPAALPAKKAG